MKIKLNIQGNEAVIEGEDSVVAKFIAGTKGKVTIKTPFGTREVKIVKEHKVKEPKVPKATVPKAKALATPKAKTVAKVAVPKVASKSTKPRKKKTK